MLLLSVIDQKNIYIEVIDMAYPHDKSKLDLPAGNNIELDNALTENHLLRRVYFSQNTAYFAVES